MRLKGQIAFITGGTGYLGRSLVYEYAKNGADVVFTYRSNSEKADELMKEIKQFGGRYLPLNMNVLDAYSIQVTVEKAVSEMGGIDILINNAGITMPIPSVLVEEEQWDLTFDINVKGYFLVTKEVLRHMIMTKRKGVVINMSSLAGVKMVPSPVHYAASKAAIVGYTYSLARELPRYGIRVNCIAPGLLEGGVADYTPKDKTDAYAAYCAVGRLGKPEEVAHLAVFLGSSESSYINGQVILCDGGM